MDECSLPSPSFTASRNSAGPSRLESADIDARVLMKTCWRIGGWHSYISGDQVAGTANQRRDACGHPAAPAPLDILSCVFQECFAGKEAKMRSFISGSSYVALACSGGLASPSRPLTHEMRLHCASDLSAASPCPPWTHPWNATPAHDQSGAAHDDNLIDGMRSTHELALCVMARSTTNPACSRGPSPAPPQLILHPLDDPEWHIYYAVRTGIRYTGCPPGIRR